MQSNDKNLIRLPWEYPKKPRKACYINDFHRSNGAYYTTITPFAKEL